MTDAETVLGRCRLFDGLGGEGTATLVALGVRRRFLRGDLIFRRGDASPGVFVVASGLVRFYLSSAAGKHQILHLVGPGHTFGEIAAVGGFPCPANAEALTDSECLLLPAAPLRRALAEDHALCRHVLGGFALLARDLMGLVEDLTLRDAAGRLARFLLEHVNEDDVVRLPAFKKDLASQFNLTSETLSRTLRRLIDAGLIAAGETSEVLILDADGLRLVRDGLGPEA